MNNKLEQLINEFIRTEGFTKVITTTNERVFEEVFEGLLDAGYRQEANMSVAQTFKRVSHLSEVVFNLNDVNNSFAVTPSWNARVAGNTIDGTKFLSGINELRSEAAASGKNAVLILVTNSNIERNALISEAFELGFGYNGQTASWFRSRNNEWTTIKLKLVRGEPTINLYTSELDATKHETASVIVKHDPLTDLVGVIEAMQAVIEGPSIPELPEINDYNGEYVAGEDFVSYGCADIDIKLLAAIINEYEGNRNIRAVTLDSGVEITKDQAEQILYHFEAVNA